LGKEKVINKNNARDFGRSCRPYMQGNVKRYGKARKQLYWPVIRSVSIKYKFPLLKSGLVLMDVPGVADTNNARNKITKDAMRDCDCICIAAPVSRAIHNKNAQGMQA
jgi:hypothetical protein